MKYFSTFLLSLFLMVSNLEVRGQESDVGYLVFVDSTHIISDASRNFSKKMTSLSTIDTIKSRREKIISVFDSSDEMLRDGVIHCLRMAMNLWEDRINFTVPIYFYVKSDPYLDPNIEIKSIVRYSRVSAQKSQPSSLYYQNYISAVYTDSIIINANVNWNFSWAYDIDGGNDNLITAFLRHIGHLLGFGTSVTSINNQVGFCIKRTFSDFDSLIVNTQGQSLSSLARNGSSSAISNFMKSNIHLTLPSGNYNLYSNQSNYVPYRSGMYYALAHDNVMNYPYGDRTLVQNINFETLEALQAIGWETTPYGITFNTSTLNSVGYGSAYKSHVFTALDKNGFPIQNAEWKYQEFHNSTKQYTDVSTATGSQILINNLYINSDCIDTDNCIQGRIICTVTNEGISKEYTMPVFLELAPDLDSYEITNIATTPNSNYYSFDIKINCLGNTYGNLLVCNEYGQTLSYNLNNSGETIIHVDNVFKYGLTYIDITLNNNYGSNSKIIYLDGVQYSNTRRSMLSNQHMISCNRNGEIIKGKVTAFAGDNLSFCLTDVNGRTIQMREDNQHIQWYLRLSKYGNITDLHELAKDTTACSLTVNTLLFNNECPINMSYVMTDKLFCDGTIRVIVRDKNGEENICDYPIRFDLLPKIPSIAIIDYQEVYDELYDELIPIVELEILAERYRWGYIHTSRGKWYEATGEAFEVGTPMPYRVKVDWGSLGCGYNCSLANEYGYVECNFVYPAQTNDISIQQTHPQIKIIHSGSNWIMESTESIDLAEIVDTKGKVHASQRHATRMDAYLNPGIYILRLHIDGKTSFRKFIVK